jgi:hypothetical protein
VPYPSRVGITVADRYIPADRSNRGYWTASAQVAHRASAPLVTLNVEVAKRLEVLHELVPTQDGFLQQPSCPLMKSNPVA